MIAIQNFIPAESEKLCFDGVEIKSPISGTTPYATAQLSDRIIVIYQQSNGAYDNLTTDNAFAFDRRGQVLFRVEAYAPANHLFSFHYSNFEVEKESGKLVISTGSGHRAYLDTSNGKIHPTVGYK